MIVEGIPVTNEEKIPSLKAKVKEEIVKQVSKNEFQKAEAAHEFEVEYDKCHRIGPIKDGKQNVIVKLKFHRYR